MTAAAAEALVAQGHELLREERYEDAASCFERAIAVFPQTSLGWKGLAQTLLCTGRVHEAARAFDQAIGLKHDSATALWGGALAHAELGNKVIAKNYLARTLALQPSWIAMAQEVPQLAAFLQTSTRAEELLNRTFGPFSKRAYRHAADNSRVIEVGRLANKPVFGQWTFVTVGLSNAEWNEPERPRVELVLATTVDLEVCGQILANLAFHLGEVAFFPQPGTMVRDVVGALGVDDVSQRLPHVYVQSPRAWGVDLPLEVGPPAITLAQVFPISEAEYQTWRRLGADRFERAMLDRNIDVADLRRSGL
jgi:tetratricopeptide (TPR) repeat protein